MSDIRNILENMGYKLTIDGSRYFRAKPVYRDSGNASSLRISRKNGWFTDYSANITGPLTDLVKLSLGLKTLDDAKSWLAQNEFEINSLQEDDQPLIEKSIKYYPQELLEKLIKNHQYWNERGVSSDLLDKYKGGIAISGVMYGRYVFPVSDQSNRIVGFAGRDISNKHPIKWKLVGSKFDWIFPSFNIEKIREANEVILVESIGDHLALEGAGIHNSIVLFGIHLSDSILSKINGLNPKKIIIGLNNDEDNGNVGQMCAKDIEQRLQQFFNPKSVEIRLPKEYSDFGEMPIEAIQEWYKS